jgi:hypothetical protein
VQQKIDELRDLYVVDGDLGFVWRGDDLGEYSALFEVVSRPYGPLELSDIN